MTQKIDRIELFHARLKLKHPFITALGQRTHTNNIILKISTNEGLEGWGECAPFPPITGETVDTCFITGRLIGERLLGKNPMDIEGISALMDKIIYGNTGIKCAFDVALYDMASKHAGKPLYEFLGGSNDKIITTDYTVSLSDPEKMANDAIDVFDRGFPAIKVKLGADGTKDVARIKAIRDAVGFGIAIRIDANQGWEPEEAINALKMLEGYNIQYCEEPISRKRYLELEKVIKSSPIKIMADESVFDHWDARKMLKYGLCNMINLKLGKSSGFVKVLKIIDEAEKYNVAMQVGGFLESRLLFTANCHLAFCSDLITYFDLDSPLFLAIDPIIGGMEYLANWEVKLPNTPGLGLTVDKDFLNDLSKEEICE
ncbi:MAG TPA: mandelate racemase/muconate lactonizing enzyme family protein [Cyclobacteriaceae bacterium]